MDGILSVLADSLVRGVQQWFDWRNPVFIAKNSQSTAGVTNDKRVGVLETARWVALRLMC